LTLGDTGGENYGMSVTRIAKEELKARIENESDSLIILDARLKYPYEHSTLKLPGAVRFQAGVFDASTLDRNKEIVAYDSDPDEVTSSHVAAELVRNGFQACVLKGGINEWVAASFPVEPKESPRPEPPAPGALKG
jgi:rhodanese-related sulfurtransferase